MQQLPEDLDLTGDEREVLEGDRDALTALADRQAIIGTPAGLTPGELDTDHAFIALTAVQSACPARVSNPSIRIRN
ncbi:hypothetical protein [Streptomyces spiramyceticus]|uniref:hypothetical protein n=1 Tax=Streptomyces spiramyceticus TaxID=299717 RepID=UPI00237ACF37|nr:hypothetical protein [Streptomyces spiramyceticus]